MKRILSGELSGYEFNSLMELPEVEVLSEAERQQFQLYEFRCVAYNELVVDRPAGFAPKRHTYDRGQIMFTRWPVCAGCVAEPGE